MSDDSSLWPDAADHMTAARTLAALGREFDQRGLLPASSGNLSMRVDVSRVLMTRSGVEKGTLEDRDFVLARLDADPPRQASAEAPLHLALYRQFPHTACVLHVHSRPAAVLSRRLLVQGQDVLELQGWELQKAIAGQGSHEDLLSLPVFANSQEVPQLAERVTARLAGMPQARAYLLAGHGLYAWGADPAQARRHVIALEVLLQSELEWRNCA